METADAVEAGPFAAAAPRQHHHDPSVLAKFDRWLARIGPAKATAVLTGIQLVFVEILHAVIGALVFPPVRFDTLASGAMVAILVSVPLVYYSQMLIRKLVASRQTLKRLTENLAVAVHEAEAANEGKSQFLANMSHELRTPLNAIIGFSEILRDESFGPLGLPRYRQYAADINTSGAHLLSIINDMLDLTKITSGKAMVDVDGECDLGDVVGTTFRMIETLAKKQEVTVERQLPGAPITVAAAERMVRQILLNILSNAVKFTPPGGRVTLSAKIQESGDLVIAVADTGIGMTQAEIGVAMTPFGQVDSRLSRKHGGTGLGLPLAKAMMELHGGKLTIKSAPQRGTTVALIFPAARLRRETATPAPALVG